MQDADAAGRIPSGSEPSRLTIGLLSVAAGPPATGAHVFDLARALSRAGHDVTV